MTGRRKTTKAADDGGRKDASPDPVLLARAHGLLDRGRDLLRQEDYKEASAVLQQGHGLMERARARPDDMALSFVSLAKLDLAIGDLDKAEAHALKAMDLITVPGTRALVKGEAAGIHGIVLLRKGDLINSLNFLERALSLFESARDKPGIANVCRNIGNVHLMKNQYGKAVAYYNRSMRLCEETGDRKGFLGNLSNIALAKGLQGLYSDAINDFKKMLDLIPDEGPSLSRATTQTNLAYFYQLTRRWDEALEHYDKASEVCSALGLKAINSYNIFGRAEVLLGKGDLKGAERELSPNLKDLMATKSEDLMGRTLRVRGMMFREKGELKRAEDDFALAETFLKGGGYEVILAQVYIEWAMTRLRAKDDRGAMVMFRKAMALYKSLNLHILEKELDETIKRTRGRADGQ